MHQDRLLNEHDEADIVGDTASINYAKELILMQNTDEENDTEQDINTFNSLEKPT